MAKQTVEEFLIRLDAALDTLGERLASVECNPFCETCQVLHELTSDMHSTLTTSLPLYRAIVQDGRNRTAQLNELQAQIEASNHEGTKS